jgi:hypothetical protein
MFYFFLSSCNATKSKEPIAFGGPLCTHHTDTQYGPYHPLRLHSAVYPICNFRLFVLASLGQVLSWTDSVQLLSFLSLLSFEELSRIWLFLCYPLPWNGCDICYIAPSIHSLHGSQPYFLIRFYSVLFHVHSSRCEPRCICTICLASD